MSNKMMMQYFEWYLPADAQHWNRAAQDAAHLKNLGVTDVWLPPAYKGLKGIEEEGYAVYDLYDLGEFNQMNTVPTKYGTKDAYIAAINAFHEQGINVLGDIVLNHRMGEDGWEKVDGKIMSDKDRNVIIKDKHGYQVPTLFTFPGRNGVYTNKILTHEDFVASDRMRPLVDGEPIDVEMEEYEEVWEDGELKKKKKKYVYKFGAPCWSDEVSKERGNFQYLMGVGTNFYSPHMLAELLKWGCWYMDMTGLDGLRLDALKHIPYSFYPGWLYFIRRHARRDLFTVGEYWDGDPNELYKYLDNCGRCMSLFDVTAHYRLRDMSEHPENFDLRTIFDNTLLSRDPEHAVTFVDNHDTQPNQALQSWVKDWFKPLAYALILLQDKGTPCVFYGDLYGIPHDDKHPVPGLEKLMQARRDFCHGGQFEEFERNSPTLRGWSRSNEMAVLMSTGGEGHMYLPAGHPGQCYVDLLGNYYGEVYINQDGWGEFHCHGGSVSVWVPKDYAQSN